MQFVVEISMRYLSPALLIVTLATDASAQAIDAPGAAQLSQSLSRYISQVAFNKSVVKIAADGDAYRINVDFKAVATLIPAVVTLLIKSRTS